MSEQLPHLDRRLFLQSLSAGAVLLTQGTLGIPAYAQFETGPLSRLRGHNWPVLIAFIETQLHSISGSAFIERPEVIGRDFIYFLEHVDLRYQRSLVGVLSLINAYTIKKTGKRFQDLSISQRKNLLNQGDAGSSGSVSIVWENSFLLHTGISSLSMLIRMIILSSDAATALVRASWGPGCYDPRNAVHMSPPFYPETDVTYDLCIVGSGAAGAVIAARAANEGLNVLIVEEGAWVSPDAIVEKKTAVDGRQIVQPPTAKKALTLLFKGGGINLTGDFSEQLASITDVASPGFTVKPVQLISLVQAKVVGGGPYINNAIHLRIKKSVWNKWGLSQYGLKFSDVEKRMIEIEQDLGVNVEASIASASSRSIKFAQGGKIAGIPVRPLPVSVIPEPPYCGGDNFVDQTGKHIGGLHPLRSDGKNSYLMRALSAPNPARIGWSMKAVKIFMRGSSAQSLLVEERKNITANRRGNFKHIRAKKFVLAAGAVGSTKLLSDSLSDTSFHVRGLGEGLNANVGCPIYAVFDQPIYSGADTRPEPGLTQCFFVEKAHIATTSGQSIEEPTLENWFFFPSALALGLTGWFESWANVMRKYNHISTCGMVVPTAVRPGNRIDSTGKVYLELDTREFELLLRGVEKIGRIYLAAATPGNGVSLYLPTRALIIGRNGAPLEIRTYNQLIYGIAEIRKRGPAFLNLLTTHLQGGNALGSVVDPHSFQVMTSDRQILKNLYVADASIFPAGCEVNPQLTVKALAHLAADRILAT